MLQNININYEALELLQFFWETAARGEKISDKYIMEIAEKPEMSQIFVEDFDEQSVRKVLSAVINKEPVNEPTSKELEFFSYNKFNADDPGNVEMMLPPVKVLNLDSLKDEFAENSKFDSLIVNFVPAYDMVYKIKDNVLTINFFKIEADWSDFDNVFVEGKILKEFVLVKAREVLQSN